ncbi:GGDEF domain-containing protein [Methylobacillus flagellatus]|uniref:diguanylate cyclase n=1 Tax=Methylobacillus flagellatus (strain ATCC 51484 / DSM 6875 / VKM B-1610 / KT) TaxID=265072 RepID=Q1H488_METFK|nr:GGDEF domain-containing protein [Methylobacillus flagellatus]ABE48699.1 diguanylate cyclase [Methylobacillus flagellatus KT]
MNAILHQTVTSRLRWTTRILMLLLAVASLLAMLHTTQPWPQLAAFAPAVATIVVLSTTTTALLLLLQFKIQKQFFLLPLAGAYAIYALAAITSLLSMHGSPDHANPMTSDTMSNWGAYWQFGFCGFIIIAMAFRKATESFPQLNRIILGKNTVPFMLTPLLGIIVYMLALNAGNLFSAIMSSSPIVTAPLGWGSWIMAAATFVLVRAFCSDDKLVTIFLSIAALSHLCHVSHLLIDNTPFSANWYMAHLLSLFSFTTLLAVLILQLSQFTRDLADSHAYLMEKAHKDSLTGIYNRGYFDETAELEWRRAQRNGTPISLLMLDIDHFKGYNDQFGHVKGDKCLKKIAQALHANMQRPGDFVARFGGEEFVVLLPATTAEGCHAMAQKLHLAVQKLKISAGDHRRVSVSIGHATWNGPYENGSINELLSQADLALYTAKRLGRNRIVRYEDLAHSLAWSKSLFPPGVMSPQ